jgi:hypothetical protein
MTARRAVSYSARERQGALMPDRKQKIKHELREMLGLTLYLAFFFCAIEIYKMFLLREYSVSYWNVGFALINALVVTKVIMIGEYAKLGRRYENRPLLFSALWKAFVFALLVFGFHILEEGIKRLIHGSDLATVSREMRIDQFGARSVVVFCTFVPLFAFRELRNRIGEDEFQSLIFGSKTEVRNT